MSNRPILRQILALAGVSAVAVLASCSAVNQPSGQGMMGGDLGYHYSKLTCSAPDTLRGYILDVRLADMGMTRMMSGIAPLDAQMTLSTVPAEVPSGRISFAALNVGWRTHELVILPLADGAVAGQRDPNADGEIDEAGTLGEASRSCAGGTGDGIRSGSVGWTTLQLAPGRYELVCNLPNHYSDGMYQELVVV